jgi:hypothetical protein
MEAEQRVIVKLQGQLRRAYLQNCLVTLDG